MLTLCFILLTPRAKEMKQEVYVFVWSINDNTPDNLQNSTRHLVNK